MQFWNIYDVIFSLVSFNITFLNAVQSLKRLSPSDVIVFGNTICFKTEHPLNASEPIYSMFVGNSTISNDIQFSIAFSEIFTTVSGINTLVNFFAFLNAIYGTLVIPFSNSIVSIPLPSSAPYFERYVP